MSARHLPLAVQVSSLLVAGLAFAPAAQSQFEPTAASLVAVDVLDTHGARNVVSGCIVDDSGTIVTNLRPLREVDKAQVKFPGGKVCRVIGHRGMSIGSDLVLLAVHDPPAVVRPIQLNLEKLPEDSEITMMGAFSNTTANKGKLAFSITGEELSAMLTGLPHLKTDLTLGTGLRTQWLCTDVALPLPNTGGALIDRAGKVVGILSYVPFSPNNPFVAQAVHASHVQALLAVAAKAHKPLASLRRAKDEDAAASVDIPKIRPAAPVVDMPAYLPAAGSWPAAVDRMAERHSEHLRFVEKGLAAKAEVERQITPLEELLKNRSADISAKEAAIGAVKKSKKTTKTVAADKNDKGKEISEDKEGNKFKEVVISEYTPAEQREVDNLKLDLEKLREKKQETEQLIAQTKALIGKLVQYSRVFEFRAQRFATEAIWLADPFRFRTREECRLALGAIDALQRAGKASLEFSITRGLLHARLGEFGRGSDEFDQLLRKVPLEGKSFVVAARSLLLAWQGDQDAALKDLTLAKKTLPVPVFEAIRAAVSAAEEEYGPAKRNLELCLKHGGNAMECRRTLALLLATSGDPKVHDADRAIAYAAAACRDSDWKDGFTLAALSLAHHRAGDREKALAAGEAALVVSEGGQKARIQSWLADIRDGKSIQLKVE